MRMRAILAAVAASLPLPSAATAEGVVCLDRNSGQVDVAATQAFADMASRTDPAVRQALAGTWYLESASPGTGQISRLTTLYGADGQLAYQNQVCDASGACSQYQGLGAWAALVLGDGSLSGIQMISDQGRNQECTGFTARLIDPGTLQYGAGGVARRVQ